LPNSDAQLSLSSTVDVLSIGSKPEAAIAAAKSLRRLAQRFRDTFAWIGTIRSRTERMAARSSATWGGLLSTIAAKQATEDRKSRRRVTDRLEFRANPSSTFVQLFSKLLPSRYEQKAIWEPLS
jgi:hypothetical protein